MTHAQETRSQDFLVPVVGNLPANPGDMGVILWSGRSTAPEAAKPGRHQLAEPTLCN